MSPRERGDDHCSDALGDRVACQHEDRAIAAWSSGEPDLTPLHPPIRTNPRPDPNRRPRPEPARHRREDALAKSPRRSRWPAGQGADEEHHVTARTGRHRAVPPNAEPRLPPGRQPESSTSSYVNGTPYDWPA